MYLNNHRYGCFSYLFRPANTSKTIQRTHISSELPETMATIADSKYDDIWISQCEFKFKSRLLVNLLRIPMSFIDLDTYRSKYADVSPEAMVPLLLQRCEDSGIPAPSIIVFSGRGLQVKWLYDYALPARALPRWNLSQQFLGDMFKDFGADPAARDASRVLRVVGSVNQKSGETCRVVYFDDSTHSFDALADAVLPLTRDELKQKREEAKKTPKKKFSVIEGGRTGNLKSFSRNQLAWDRLHDLRDLFEMRGGVAVGSRMVSLLWLLNFMCLSGQINSNTLLSSAHSLAHEIAPDWKLKESELGTLKAKVEAYNNGERVTFNGKECVPLYTPKNAKLIEIFEITEEEQAKLKTIISPELAKTRRLERDKIRKVQERRENGARSHADSERKRQPWEALGISRATYYRKKKNGQI